MVLSFRPRMIQSYAAGDYKSLNMLFKVNNLFIMCLLSCAAIPIIFEMRIIMYYWLKDGVSENMVLFSRLFIVYTLILSMHNPITIIIQASGIIKYYHLLVESIMVLSLPLTFVLFRFGMPAYTVFWSMIGLCIIAHFVRIICLKCNYKEFSVPTYFVQVLLRGGVAVALGVVVAYLLHTSIDFGLLRLCVMMVVSPLSTLVFVYLLCTTQDERSYINSFVAKIFKR